MSLLVKIKVQYFKSLADRGVPKEKVCSNQAHTFWHEKGFIHHGVN
jgi:hypothetical protein